MPAGARSITGKRGRQSCEAGSAKSSLHAVLKYALAMEIQLTQVYFSGGIPFTKLTPELVCIAHAEFLGGGFTTAKSSQRARAKTNYSEDRQEVRPSWGGDNNARDEQAACDPLVCQEVLKLAH
jgi:hypothetical protein